MSNKIERKITEYVSLKMTKSGESYDFTDKKTGKQVTGTTKDAIKIKTPYGSLSLLPHEMKALLNLVNDPEVMKEIESRIKHE